MKPSHLTIIASAGLLGGCAQHFMASAQKECSAFGFTPGTADYANCVQQQYQAGQSNYQQRLLNASRIMNQGSSPVSHGGGSAGGTAFLRSSYVSGMNRVCQYNRMGSAYVITIGAAEMCPISVP